MMNTINIQNDKWHKLTNIDNFILVSSIYMIISIMIPAFNVNIPRLLRISIALITIAGFYLCILLKSRELAFSVISFTILVIGFILLIHYTKWASYYDVFTNSYNMFFFWYPAIQAFYYANVRDRKRLKLVLNIIIIAAGFTAFTTIIGLERFPLAARELASANAGGSAVIYSYYNIGGYGFIYSLVLLIPSVAFRLKNTTGIMKLPLLLILILYYFCIIKAQYTTAVLISFLIIIPLLFKRINSSIIIFISLFSSSIIILQKEQFIRLFQIMSNSFGKAGIETLSERFEHIYYSLRRNELVGGALNRGILYKESFNSFIKSPLIGNLFSHKKNSLGGHSELLDILGGSGLFGFGIFIAIMLIYKKNVLKSNNQIAMIVIFAFLFLGFVNTLFTASQIGLAVFLVPCFIQQYYPDEELKEVKR